MRATRPGWRQSPVLVAALLPLALAACGLRPDPPPEFPIENFGGTGDRMAECMQFASQSYCEQQTWGGGES